MSTTLCMFRTAKPWTQTARVSSLPFTKSSIRQVHTKVHFETSITSRKVSTLSTSERSAFRTLLSTTEVPPLPTYLVDTYTWAYLSKQSVPFLDSHFVVSSILWGNANRLMKAAIKEFVPGQKVLQPACVYGSFSRLLADHIGPEGQLVVSDVAPLQLERLRPKVEQLPHVTLALADARNPVGGPFDGVCCFFLLHEVPDDVKADIVKSLFRSLEPGGKLVFVDYHKPFFLHPLKGVMSVVFDTLEPFAKGLWEKEIESFCPNPNMYEWTKETYFGGLYQKVIAQCKKY